MPDHVYLFLHLVGVLHLIGFTFYAFAGPSANTRKWIVSLSGVASLLVVATGLIMVMDLGNWPGWVWFKLFSWIGISAFAGIAYRRRGLTRILMVTTIALAILALWAVTFKPF